MWGLRYKPRTPCDFLGLSLCALAMYGVTGLCLSEYFEVFLDELDCFLCVVVRYLAVWLWISWIYSVLHLDDHKVVEEVDSFLSRVDMLDWRDFRDCISECLFCFDVHC